MSYFLRHFSLMNSKLYFESFFIISRELKSPLSLSPEIATLNYCGMRVITSLLRPNNKQGKFQSKAPFLRISVMKIIFAARFLLTKLPYNYPRVTEETLPTIIFRNKGFCCPILSDFQGQVLTRLFVFSFIFKT